MKRYADYCLSCLFPILLLLTGCQYAHGQPDGRQFLVAEYIKIEPGTRNSFLKLQKEVWKKIEQERRKAGQMEKLELYELLVPSGSLSDYDFVSYHTVRGWNAIETLREEVGMLTSKHLSKEQQGALERSAATERVVKTEIWEIEDRIRPNKPSPPARYHLANFMQVTDGKWDEYMEMEKQLVKPIHEEHTRIGGRAGWVLLSLRAPDGAARAYQAGTFDLFDRWSDINKNDQTDFYSQIHPGKSPEYISRQITGTRSLICQEIRMLVEFVE